MGNKNGRGCANNHSHKNALSTKAQQDYSTVLRVTAICSAFMLFCIYFVPRVIYALTFGHWVA